MVICLDSQAYTTNEKIKQTDAISAFHIQICEILNEPSSMANHSPANYLLPHTSRLPLMPLCGLEATHRNSKAKGQVPFSGSPDQTPQVRGKRKKASPEWKFTQATHSSVWPLRGWPSPKQERIPPSNWNITSSCLMTFKLTCCHFLVLQQLFGFKLRLEEHQLSRFWTCQPPPWSCEPILCDRSILFLWQS